RLHQHAGEVWRAHHIGGLDPILLDQDKFLLLPDLAVSSDGRVQSILMGKCHKG
ncbi:hypothetical protein HKBW3S06_01757, partial [Candidatus Hakubella thermalkaliphila]